MICYQYLGYINVLGGFFLSVTNKMVESLLQCQTFSQMFFHIIEKVRILNIYIYMKQISKIFVTFGGTLAFGEGKGI